MPSIVREESGFSLGCAGRKCTPRALYIRAPRSRNKPTAIIGLKRHSALQIIASASVLSLIYLATKRTFHHIMHSIASFFLHVAHSPASCRWHHALATIYSCRSIISLAESARKKRSDVCSVDSSSPPHIVLNIEVEPIVESTCCAHVDQQTLSNIIKEKDHLKLEALGGTHGIASSLDTNTQRGIHEDPQNILRRQDLFGSNTFPRPPPKHILAFVLQGFKDTTIIILLVCVVFSLTFGIKEEGLKEGWYDGGSILIAVFLVIAVGAASNFRQSRQFSKLEKENDKIRVDAVRDGRRRQILAFDIVVGDIVCLKTGDQVPADGLLLDGYSLHLDESSMTGESCPVVIDMIHNPFLMSGAKVVDGHGRMLVIAVGIHTTWGEMMSSITHHSEEKTPLQTRLDRLATHIGKVGLAVALTVLVVLLVRYFTGRTEDEKGNTEFTRKTKVSQVINDVASLVAISVTIVVVAIPEGLPLAVTLTLAYSMKQMMADQAMVRTLPACETMGSATTICTDKTGTLTMNQMKVTRFWIGKELIEDNISTITSGTAAYVKKLIHQGIGLNTTGDVCQNIVNSTPQFEFSGSPTEKALLSWAVLELGMDIEELRSSSTVLSVEAFNSEKKRSGIAHRENGNNFIHVHWKGAAEMIVDMCSSYIDIHGEVKEMNTNERAIFKQIIQGMAAHSLRCLALAYKHMEEIDSQRLAEDDLILLCLVGIKDPCRPGVKEAVEACQAAGVDLKMITGDNVITAKTIAIECGILKPNQDMAEAVVEGKDFRNYTEAEQMEKVGRIRVMARSSPLDKLLMVKCLKKKGEVVCVTGDGTNDAPALKEADIGLAMGIQGTEVAKSSSDVVVLDDNFGTIVTVLRWGRCVFNNIQKFLQFQLTVNVAAVTINFIAAISSGEVPLTTVQLLWVNLIMDTLGALALATERPTEDLLHKDPVGRTAPLITNIMWRNLFAQASYQIAILLILQFKGTSIFGVTEKVKNTMIFNTFVLCQIFNEFNARELEKKNTFKGIVRNKLFVSIVGTTVVLQVMMVELLKQFADTERLGWAQWGACICMAAVSWPLAIFVKFIPVPEKPLLNFFKI